MKKIYTTPTLELIEVEIEKGFASSTLENPEDGGTTDW